MKAIIVSLSIIALGLGIYSGLTAAQPRSPEPSTPPKPMAKSDFEEVTVVIKPFENPVNAPGETIRISADGKCLYIVSTRPAFGELPAWPGARLVHTISPTQLAKLNQSLRDTDWVTKDVNAPKLPPFHQNAYEIALERDGKTTKLELTGEPKTYQNLLLFFRSIARQEYLLYRLERVPLRDVEIEARRDLDHLVAADLGEPFVKSPLDIHIDYDRYLPWAQRLVRRPFGKETEDVRTAVRLVGMLKLESEREYLADLASDRDRQVRTAVAAALGRLGGKKSVSVLRKMVRSTGREAAWELICLGPVAVPTIVKIIRDSPGGEDDLSYESLIRAYIEHWKEIEKPLHPKIVEAVRTSLAAPKVKAYRTEYHTQFLGLVAHSEMGR